LPINEIEFKVFIGLLLLFGITQKNNIEIDEIWELASVHHFIHSNNNKFIKFNEIFEKFRTNVKACLVSGKHLTEDEELYSFRGRCIFRRYMPNKPARYGIKFWSLADVLSNYLLDSLLYLGKFGDISPRETKVGENVFKLLCEPFYSRNRCITADNFFSSISLAKFLISKGLSYLGTLRANKA
jgi:hypothetical protein